MYTPHCLILIRSVDVFAPLVEVGDLRLYDVFSFARVPRDRPCNVEVFKIIESNAFLTDSEQFAPQWLVVERYAAERRFWGPSAKPRLRLDDDEDTDEHSDVDVDVSDDEDAASDGGDAGIDEDY